MVAGTDALRLSWWPHTTKRSVASFRLRCAQIVERLRTQGVAASLYAPGQTGDPPDVLVLSKRYDAQTLTTALAMRERHGTRLVLDLCDNHFFASSDDPKWAARTQQLRAVASQVDLVVASTAALADVVRNEVGPRTPVTVIGDAADPPRAISPRERLRHPVDEWRLRSLERALKSDRGCHLVWFGNHGSGYADGGMLDLAKLRPILEAANARYPVSLTVVSNNRRKFDDLIRSWRLPARYVEWRENTVSRVLRLHEVALIPITPNPFTICKTNNRVATSLLHGLAVVADSIPSYLEFADACVLDDWGQGFDRLVADPGWRESLVLEGRARVEARWQAAGIAEQWREVLTALGRRRPIR